MEIYLFAYTVLGLLAGVLAGLLGIGGGLVIVPALIILFQYQGFDPASLVHVAIGSSLMTIIPTSIVSALAHHAKGAVDWRVFTGLAPGLLVGALVGALLADQLQTLWLQRVFAVFLLLVAGRMLWGKNSAATAGQIPGAGILNWLGALIGLISGLLGIGGGTMTVPMLVKYGKPLAKAVATSAACGFPIALAGGLGFVWCGEQQAGFRSGYVYWPAVLTISISSILAVPWGVMLAHSLPVAILKRIFAWLLLLVGLKLLSG